MIVVVVSTVSFKIKPILEEYDFIYTMKQRGPQLFFYFDTDKPQREVEKWVKQTLVERMGKGYVIQVFTMMKGKIDFFEDYSQEQRNKMKYYDSYLKDVTQADFDKLYREHPEIKNKM